jgi:hypothetical protein
LIHLADQGSIDIKDGLAFLGARLTVSGMGNACKAEAGWHQRWPRSLEYQLLTCRWIVALEATVVDDPRDVIADQRMDQHTCQR